MVTASTAVDGGDGGLESLTRFQHQHFAGFAGFAAFRRLRRLRSISQHFAAALCAVVEGGTAALFCAYMARGQAWVVAWISR